MPEIILIQISGEDKPGLTSSLTEVLAGYNIDILDIGQSVIHNQLVLGVLIRLPREAESAPVLKDLMFKGYELGVNVKFKPIESDRYKEWVDAQGKPRHIITLVGNKTTGRLISKVSDIIAENGLNIDFIHRLSGRIPMNGEPAPRHACVEFSARGTPLDPDLMRARILTMATEEQVDIALQEDNAFRRNRRLVAFDMDSTLIQAEVIDELAKAAGSGEVVSRITEAAMRGEIDFQESLRQRLATLKGLDEAVMEDIAKTLPITEGAERLISNLKKFGYKTAIISGGFTYFGKKLQKHLGVDYIYANELEIIDGKLTGNVIGDIVDGPKKAELLTEIAKKEKISLQQVIAVGDGANDLPMLSIAGLGIAFHAKPKVRQDARQSISHFGLDSILYLVGLRDRETD
ncbi:phosphoserine phosphatase SerB [Maridesulfovibrio ferrireducens]|uniref:phosphoserine phosphatase SerB n=1 Tax=Maridesulfovibrio ferrireducens TaxID=246191 RepID=UPI001A2D95A7|nr:phosphoserine phosphatase SerB [Maridesulfovibrio ferrireducens]MBI9111979.1 phosphoserine phosphatase SerB [Maridesulfovibrio ferrireducens]